MTTTANTQSAEKIHLIQATTTPDGEVKFVLPIKPELVQSVEAIDLDLMLVSSSGEKYILQQGALLATTNSESKLVFSNGDAMSAADQIKRMGVLKPVEGGSFRLASALTPEAADKVTGNEFGLGKDTQDTVAKIEKLLQSLESSTQSSQNSESTASTQSAARSSSFKSNADPLASPAPGTPPQVIKNSDNESAPNVTFSLYAANKDGVTHQDVLLGKTEVRQIFTNTELSLDMKTAKALEFETGIIDNQLILSGVPTTKFLIVNISNQRESDSIPAGLKIEGKEITAGIPLTLEVTEIKDNVISLKMQWNEGNAAASSNFQMTVSYLGSKGETLLKTISFTGNPDNAYTLDANGEPRQFIASKANNLIITANDQDNIITLGNGNDTIKGSKGADTINGGGGKNTVDYSDSTAPVTVNVVTGVGTGGQANDDQLSNIQILKGSSLQSDTLNFSGARTAVNVDFISGTTNQKLNGSDQDLTFSGFENAVGSANDDLFVANGATNNFKGGDGSDTLSYAGSTAVVVNLHTGQGADGNARGDTYESVENLIGSSFNDTFVASAAANTFTGGGGVDRVNYVHSTSGVTVNLSNGQGSGGFAAGDKYIGIVNATGSNHNDTFVGNNQGNNFQGGDGVDTVSYVNSASGVTVNLKDQWGSGGDASSDSYSSIENAKGSAHNDTFISGAGANDFDGLGGVNTLSYANSTAGVNVNLATGLASGGHATGDTFVNIQNLTGSAHNDVLTGDGNNNVLMGGTGADQFFGGGGTDTDTVSYQDSTAGLSIDVDNTTLGGGRGTGFAKGDVIANDVERILGSNSDDTFFSTRAGVVLDGGGGTDTVDFGLATAGVTVNLGDTSKFVNIERVVGSAHNDTLTASNSGSTLLAGDGNDTVTGGSGGDFINMVTNNTSLVGDSVNAGAGNDTVLINAAHVGGTVKNLDGGTGFDTLRVIAGATLDMGALNAQNFERVDLRTDGGATQVSLSSADIRTLVNSGSGNNVLTLRLDSSDSYLIDAAQGETVTQGQSVNFYNGSAIPANLIAQVNFEYV
jgi:Ca2+-binding RTX toxin-like protein